MTQVRKTRQPRGEWLDSRAAPFIRQILRAKDDAGRTQAVLVFADWLEANGDPPDTTGYAFWFRHPALKWEVRLGLLNERSVSWRVDPWSNKGHGQSARIDTHGWTLRYPTLDWLRTEACAELVRVWLKNRVDLETYYWTHDVAHRIRLGDVYDKAVKERAESREHSRKIALAHEARELSEYQRLKEKFKHLEAKT